MIVLMHTLKTNNLQLILIDFWLIVVGKLKKVRIYGSILQLVQDIS